MLLPTNSALRARACASGIPDPVTASNTIQEGKIGSTRFKASSVVRNLAPIAAGVSGFPGKLARIL